MSPSRGSGATRVTRRKSAKKPASRTDGSGLRDLTGIIDRRRRRRWVRRLVAALVAAVLVALVAVGIWLVGFSSVMALTRVEVTGTNALSADEVRTAAAAPLGRPLARVETAPISARVARLIQVSAVTVEKHYPHALRIVVHERTPAFVLHTKDADRLVDSDGVDFRAAPDPLPDGLSIVDLPDGGSQQLYTDLATVALGLPKELKGSTLTADSRDSITVSTADGRVVFWGSSEDTPLKGRVATSLMASVKANIYDVSSPSHPVTR